MLLRPLRLFKATAVRTKIMHQFVTSLSSRTKLVADFQTGATKNITNLRHVSLEDVYELTMAMLLRNGGVYAVSSSAGEAAELKCLFDNRCMTDAMRKSSFFADFSWNADMNQFQLCLAGRYVTSDNANVTPRVFNTATGDRRNVLSITWNGVQLTKASEMIFTGTFPYPRLPV
jgi:hypothetical protein